MLDGTVSGTSDSNAALCSEVEAIPGLRQCQLSGVGPAVPRLGVGHIKHVVAVDVEAAWSAKLEPLRKECAVLVEDLDSIVLTVGHEQPAAGIESESMDQVEFAGT